ncbi:MAG: DUF814 domain-containing protein [Polyangiaceae bacterium]|nr:DUF814 domain-containing protein [Polyangiaceae bacterium]
MASKGRPYRTVNVEGFEILIGKGDAFNDHLTFEIADDDDFWLHVADYAGTHVVVRNPDRLSVLPSSVAQAAAQQSVHHSKARGAKGKVAVHLCRISDVSKRRGAPAGEVQLRTWEVLKIYPQIDG